MSREAVGPPAERKPPLELAIAEYTSLRTEILHAQQQRALFLGLTFTALGVISGFALGSSGLAAGHGRCELFTPGLIAFAMILLAAATHFTTILTQRIDLLAGYIRTNIERDFGGLWETRWKRHRDSLKGQSAWPGKLPLGTSKGYAYYYGVLTVGMLGEYFLAGGYECLSRLLIVVPPFLGAAALAWDLHERKSKRWVSPFDEA